MSNSDGQVFRISKVKYDVDENLQEICPHPDSWKDEKLDKYGNIVWLICIDDLVTFAKNIQYKIVLEVDSENTEENFPEIEIYNEYRE